MNKTISHLLKKLPVKVVGRRELNCWTAGITKKRRLMYEKTYPTILVLPDGCSINIDYHEPRKIIELPLDLSLLSEMDKRLRLERRRPKTKVKVEEDLEIEFDESRYVSFGKN